MSGRIRLWLMLMLALALIIVGVNVVNAWTALPVAADPLVRMPGTQPAQGVNLESPNRCLNCHAGYNPSVEPGFNWQGSMMAQSARDPIFWAAMTVAAQDSIWAVGTPNATDICERCHFPKGWLEGRSDPTNASAMTGADYDGVQCDFCHRMYDPFYQNTFTGLGESDDWLFYWDETNLSGSPSQPAASATHQEDMLQAQALTTFANTSFYINNQPFSPAYTEATGGQYYVSTNAAKRASFADAAARHQMFYSRFHKSQTFCATCHDVSNPVLANLLLDDPSVATLFTEENAAYAYFHAERTYSEFHLSAYSGGAAGIGPFAPDQFDTSNPGNVINKCQDCHMRDVVGMGANKNGAPVRPSESVEHPQSGQPLHDLTGGNVWVSAVLASAIPGSPNYNATNDALLHQGPAVLTLDLSQGQGIDPVALLAGSERAAQQLLLAATIDDLSYDAVAGALSFRIQNQTGHKLISGFPEGRRMFVNVKVFAGTDLIYEINPYDEAAGTLQGLNYPYAGQGLPDPATLAANEAHEDALVYEVHPSSVLTGEDETFHFALATDRFKDNRIPPMGFDVAGSVARLAQPRWQGEDALGMFTFEEYAGGYDEVSLTVPAGGTYVEVNLFYQTTSREYIEFLRDEINGDGTQTLGSPAPSGEAQAYIIQNDPFFGGLKAWGDTIWQLWVNNMNLPGAAPVLMTQATVGSGGGQCDAPIPMLLAAEPGHSQVTLVWSDEHAADPTVTGYTVYYDQADKTQFVATTGLATTYLDTGLTNGQTYCYVVTSTTPACESAVSNTVCATPSNQTVSTVGVRNLVTGYYEGKGGNKTFVPATSFAAGTKVIIRAELYDTVTNLPLAGGIVDYLITGPTPALVTSTASDAAGLAEATWSTRKNSGGQYTVSVQAVTLSGYEWDGVSISVTVTLQ